MSVNKTEKKEKKNGFLFFVEHQLLHVKNTKYSSCYCRQEYLHSQCEPGD